MPSNNYYTHGSVPQNNTPGDAAEVGAEFDSVQAGFAKMPTLTGNSGKVVKVNSGGTGLETQAADALVAAMITAAGAKTTPVDADLLTLTDSAASFVLKKFTWANLKATLASTFSTLAQLAAAGGAALVGNTPAGSIAATTVQAAINELDTEKAALAGSASQAFSVASLEVGNADTTLSRVSAGVLAVEGLNLATTVPGTWVPNQGAGLTVVGAFSSSGFYVKNGRMVTVTGRLNGGTSVALGAIGLLCSNLPFTSENTIAFGVAINAAGNTRDTIYSTASTTSLASVAGIAATATIHFSVTYIAAA